MSYTSRAAYMNLAASAATVAGRDAWIDAMARFLEFAGWTRTVVGSYFEVETTAPALSYEFFGGNPANDPFWKIVRTSDNACRIVGDALPPGYTPTCPFIATGTNSAVNTHAGVVSAILALFSGFTAQAITSTKTRFITDAIYNAQIILTIGASLSSTPTAPGFGGYLLTSQANTRRVAKLGLPVTYGANNWIKLFIAQRIAPFGDIVIAASKGFSAYPPDTPKAPDGPGPLTGYRTQYAGWDNSVQTYAFATPYSCVASTPSRGGGAPEQYRDHLEVAALKLIDFRRNLISDLPVQEAIVFQASGVSTGNKGFYNSCRLGGDGPMLVVLNGAGRFQESADNAGDPQLTILHGSRSGGGATADNNGVPWASDCPAGPLFEPWIAFNPFSTSAPGAIVGQFPDMGTVYQVYATPQTAGTFSWDGQTWRPYTKNGSQTATLKPTGTVCLRVTDTFVP